MLLYNRIQDNYVTSGLAMPCMQTLSAWQHSLPTSTITGNGLSVLHYRLNNAFQQCLP